MYTVYILQSLKNHQFYKGLSDKLDIRLKQHFDGRVLSTKYLRPLKLIHVEFCNNRVEARELEKFFKSGYGREVIIQIAEELQQN